ncbi:MAG: secondary thiamine-phosphate synthase enzyme YjbQ [Candidatus Baldrarchaeia archaeon]
MRVFSREISFNTRGEIDIIDITGEVEKIVRESGVKNGIATVFIPGATGAITTIEYEPGLIEDFKDALRRLIPREIRYRHPVNGHSHVRASLLGPSVTVPIIGGHLHLGTWQQIVFIELDTRPRHRRVIVQIVGE